MRPFLRPGAVPAAALFLGLIALPAGAAPLATDLPGVEAGNAQGPAPFRFYGTGGSRTQHVYEAELFDNFGGAARSISAIAFRAFPGAFPSAFFGTTLSISDVKVALSTTARGDEGQGRLSARFAENIGGDVAVVFEGALSLTTSVIGSFDYLLTFQTPFVYDPGRGNLLLDVTIPTTARVGGTGLFGFLTFDTVNTLQDGIFSVVSNSDGGAQRGTLSTAGAVTRVLSDPVAVPAPGALGLFLLGTVALGAVHVLRRPRAQHADRVAPGAGA
jgi:hypothetical protein